MSTLRITQVRSLIGTTKRQRATMATLGLRRIRHSIEIAENPGVLGALKRVEHLVLVEKL